MALLAYEATMMDVTTYTPVAKTSSKCGADCGRWKHDHAATLQGKSTKVSLECICGWPEGK